MRDIKLVDFNHELLDAAGRLLAQRHQSDRARLVVLPSAFEDPKNANDAIRAIWGRDTRRGFAAVNDENLVGFLIGYHLSGSFSDRSGWITLAGHAISPEFAPELYHELYAALAEQWVDVGIYNHYVMVAAGDQSTLQKWFSLGFGLQQAYAYRPLSDKDQPPTAPSDIEIRRARPEDADVVASIADTNVRYQNGSPVFAATPPEYDQDVREGYVELINEPAEGTLWLAIQNERVVGYQAYTPIEDDPTDLTIPDNSIALPAAGTIESVRGQGIGRLLTQYCFAQAKVDGYANIVADWRTTNMLASRFWAKNGFIPLAYRLERRIDPNIAWARLR
jgi:ribosomal protein S18 acetylase RimI-like enzyme